jgi:hypothetical protein
LKIHHIENEENVIEALIETLEKEAGDKVFTLRITGESNDWVEILVVFENKEILFGKFTVQTLGEKLACRIQGNYI